MPPRTSAALDVPPSREFARTARQLAAAGAAVIFSCGVARGQADYADPYYILTLAGSPATTGSADGAQNAALFNFPSGIARDISGNAYVVDTNNNTVRKITPGGIVTTLAGSPGNAGFADGLGASARFNFGGNNSYPAVDGAGNVYVADTLNSTIRKITPSGQVSTFAGTEGAHAISDGPLASALFSRPTAVAADDQGDLFVADDRDLVREISNTGSVSTLAGNESSSGGPHGPADGVGTSATFTNIGGIAVTPSGIIYVTELTDVRAILPGAVVTTIAGQSGTTGVADGQGSAARFWGLAGIALDALGNLYVSDSSANNIREISSSGLVTTIAGPSVFSLSNNSPAPAGFDDGTGSAVLFRSPTGIASDPSGNLYIADTANSFIRVGTPSIPQTSGPAPTPTPTPPSAPSGPPTIVTQPAPQTADTNSAATFWVLAAGAPGSFQWNLNGAPIPGANLAYFSISPVQSADAGNYTVTVSNNLGSVTSAAASLTINTGAAANGGTPDISLGPPSETVASGATVLFTALLNGQYPVPLDLKTGALAGATHQAATRADSGTAYQWFFGTAPIAGANGPTLLLTGATAEDGGTYSCLATNSIGSVFTSGTTLSVVQTTDPGHLANISCRSNVAAGAAQLIIGFVVGGAGTGGTEPFLIRASGPALGTFGVTGFLSDPSVTLDASGTTVASDAKWGGSAAISSASSAVGAFAWNNSSSLDSALLETLGGGGYTAQVNGVSGDQGIALAEVYDDLPGAYSATAPRLINISSRTQVGTGGGILIAGFVISGTTSMSVLIRASGPALTEFSVPGILPDPALSLYRSNSDGTSSLVESDVGWGGSALISATSASVGAFSWGSAATPDSAILVTLPPGAYTAQVSGALGDTGVALVEVYEVQ